MYQEKFYHQYCDKYGNTHRVAIHEWGYVGPSTEVECGYQQFVVERENTNEIKMGGIYPTRATATFRSQSGFDLEELFTGDERTYRLIKTKNGILDWEGNVVPNGFTRATWDSENSDIIVKATDNLATLQGKPFTDEYGENYGNVDDPMRSFLWVIAQALKKTGLNLPIRTMVDLKTLVAPLETGLEQAFTAPGSGYFVSVGQVTDQRAAYLTSIITPHKKIRVTSGPLTGATYTVVNVWAHILGPNSKVLFISVEEPLTIGDIFTEFEVYDEEAPSGLVLARRGHFNDFAPSEIGIFKEGVDFSFLQVGDTVKISADSPSNPTANAGTYTVTSFVESVPPDTPYIRIQLSPQVPVQIHQNVIVEILSKDVNFPDPLYHTYHDVRTWIRDSSEEGKSYYEVRGGAMTTWEVLDAIARQWGFIVGQNQGRWEIIRWNAYRVPAGTYRWSNYDPDGNPIGYTDFSDEVVLPCIPSEAASRSYGTILNMDRVLARVIVNYRFKYKQEGDSLSNILRNGNFTPNLGFPDIGNPSTFTPKDWKRASQVGAGVTPPASMLISYVERPASGVEFPPNINSFIELSGMPHDRLWLSSYTGYPTDVNANDKLEISWWQSTELVPSTSSVLQNRTPAWLALRIIVLDQTDPTKYYMLVNDSIPKFDIGIDKAKWVEYTGTVYSFMTRQNPYAPSDIPPDNMSRWTKKELEVPPVPINGSLIVEIIGAAVAYDQNNMNPPVMSSSHMTRYYGLPYGGRETEPMSRFLTDKKVRISGMFVGRLVDTSSEVVPQIDPFMYPGHLDGLTRRYSDTIPEIQVLTGDDYGDFREDRISGMWWGGVRTSMWDSWDARYGWSRQGLITAKSIMEQYWSPSRLLEIDLEAEGLHWSTRITFEELPGLTFAILRGGFYGPNDTFKGTLTQVDDQAAEPLPPGGDDGGNTVDPNWQPSGVFRCERGVDGLNTGNVEFVEVDTNAASPTYGQERWVVSEPDTDMCPIGMPPDLYWGASELPIDVSSLQTYPVQKDGNEYIVSFDNDDTGKYLVLLHRSALGTIQSIKYVEVPYEAYDVPDSSWEYQADITLNGVVYKVIRQKYVTGNLNKMPLNLTIG